MKPKRWKRILGRTIALAVLGALGYGALLLGKVAGPNPMTWWDLYSNPRKFFGDKDRLTVLIVGKDYNRAVSSDPTINGQPHTKGARADTVILMALDLKNAKAAALSIPRDTWVTAPDGQSGKINGTYVRGGIDLLGQTVTQLTGITPDYTIELKDDAVKNIVNAVGGVTVETIDEMHRDDSWGNLHVHLPKGVQRLTGEQAVGFARYREPTLVRWENGEVVRGPGGRPIDLRRSEIRWSKEDGDVRRTERQRQLIRAIIDEAKKPANLLRAPELVKDALAQVETKLTEEQLKALGSLYRQMATEGIQTGALPARDGRIGRTSALIVDPEKARLMADWLLRGDETAGNRLTSVAVKNGTRTPGLARRAADELRERAGFDARAGNATADERQGEDEALATRIIYGKAALLPRVEAIAQLLGGGQKVKDVSEPVEGAPDITVVIGRDLADQLTLRSAQR